MSPASSRLRPCSLALAQHEHNRGARIRTGDLADPNGARYQAAPRPDAPAVSHIAYVRPVPAVAAAEIIAELDRILEPQRFDDYGPNGLQVPGASEVATLATGVSANVELFEQAVAEQAQLLLVHHGLFWGSGTGPIDAAMKRRLKLLFDANIGLAAYHLPLDAHPQFGNNALLARALGATHLEPFALHHGEPIGFLATLADADDANPGDGRPGNGIPATDLFTRVRELTARDPLVFDAGPARIRKIAIVSGAGSDYLADAASSGRRRAAHRRARRARDGQRARVRPALHRRRPLRDRDVRRQRARRPPRRALRHPPRLPRRAQPDLTTPRHRSNARPASLRNRAPAEHATAHAPHAASSPRPAPLANCTFAL